MNRACIVVKIRLICEDDAEPMASAYRAQTDLHSHTTGMEPGINSKTAFEFIKRAESEAKYMQAFRYGIFAPSGKIVGVVELHKINWIHRRADVGIQIWDSSNRNKGFGRAALSELLHMAFRRLNLNRLSAKITSNNTASVRLFKSVGFSKEGLLREYIFTDGQYRDAEIFGYVRRDYSASR